MNEDQTNPKDLEFLAQKTSDFIDKQLNSYRQKHANSGSIITVIALFIPFFLNGLDDSYLFIKIISIIPVGILLYAIILLIGVLKTKSLDQGFHIDKVDELVNKSYEEILLYEIGANRCSFNDNKTIIDRINVNYFLAINSTVIAIIFSSSLLLINKFYKPEKKDKISKVEIIKQNNMATEKDNSKSGTENKPNTDRVIPQVPPTDRTNLNDQTPNLIIKQNGEEKTN